MEYAVAREVFFTGGKLMQYLRFLIPVYPENDSWTWRYSKTGEFTVRSAYYAELKEGETNVASGSDLGGVEIWNNL